MNKVKYLARLGPVKSGNTVTQILVTEDDIIYKTMAGLRSVKEEYPIAGARAIVDHEQSGYRNQHHMITTTVTMADGQPLVIVQQEKGGSGLKAVAAARQFAAEVTRLSAAAKAWDRAHGQ